MALQAAYASKMACWTVHQSLYRFPLLFAKTSSRDYPLRTSIQEYSACASFAASFKWVDISSYCATERGYSLKNGPTETFLLWRGTKIVKNTLVSLVSASQMQLSRLVPHLLLVLFPEKRSSPA